MCGESNYRMELATLWTETVLYGIYVMLFAASIYITVWQRPNMRYLIITNLLFAFITVYAVADLLRILLTPIMTSSSDFEDGGLVSCVLSEVPAGRHELIINNSFGVLQNSVATAMLFIGDSLLIHRCFVLWDSKKRIIALPLVLLLATTVCNIMSVYYDSRLVTLQRSGSPTLETEEALAAQSAVVANVANWLSLATNIITTFLAALRIWSMTRGLKAVLGPESTVRYYSAIAMLVESGALYSTSLLMGSIIATFPTIQFVEVVASAISQLFLVIAPTLIIVRVGMGKGFDDVQDSLHASYVANSRVPALHQFALRERGTGTMSGIQFRTVQETESTTSRLDNSGDNGGAQDLPTVEKSEGKPADSGAIV